MTSSQPILILGGSTFMGKSLLSRLSAQPTLDVHYVNRGRKYWNNESRSIKNVSHTYGNREDKKDFSKVLNYLSRKMGISGLKDAPKWLAVVDFSAFNYKHVRSVYNALRGKTKLYVFISTDSIYDLCDEKIREGELIKEEFDTRPEDFETRKRLIRNDEYGHDKLKCEEYLEFLRNESLAKNQEFDFPYLILRLPDVIGPYDDSNRYWSYIKLITEYEKAELHTSKEIEKKPISFVYSEDVAALLERLVFAIWTESLKKEALYQSYNLAFDEKIRLSEFLTIMCKQLKIPAKSIVNKEDPINFYPSVDCGALDTSKAKKLLGWSPTPLKIAVEQSNAFFVAAKGKYQDEERKVEEKLAKKLKIN